jgi:transcriptional regulator with XRE-family HTH domain
MISWGQVIIRYRHLNGLTQAAFGELVGVEQATVSRWERGNQRPDLSVQKRLRGLLGRGHGVSDSTIIHRVRTALSAVKLADKNGRNLAASKRAAQLHGVTLEFLEQLEYRNFFTDVLDEQWKTAREIGFFEGNIASIHTFNTWVPACGGSVRYCEGIWTPIFLSDGEVVLASEFTEIDALRYDDMPPASRFSIVTVDELVR